MKCFGIVSLVQGCHYFAFSIVFYIYNSFPNISNAFLSIKVGGEMFGVVLDQMKKYGRVAVCGAISVYNEKDPEKTEGKLSRI